MLIVIVAGIVLVINYIKSNGNSDEETMKCIAENSQLVVKEGCPACAYQKEILKDYLDNFKIIDCIDEYEKCAELEIKHIPTWIIDREKYEGVRSIEQLKQLTGC